MKQPIAIVASGGGMSCSYSAGVLDAIANYYHYYNPDIAIAGSGSTGTLAYYVAGQYKSLSHIWINLLHTRKFVSKRRFWRMVDIDYLIDEVLSKQDPLDVGEISSSNINFLIPSTNVRTGELTYFSNQDTSEADEIFEFLRASKALPIVFNKHVEVDGEKYVDTYLSANVSAHIKKAIELGARTIIVSDNGVERPFNESIFNLWLRARSKEFKNHYNHVVKETQDYKPPKEIDFIFVRPSSPLKVGTLNIKQYLLKETVHMGYCDAVNNKKLQALLKQ
jgi:predicted patatin/cPLA2 family phospholipase